MSCERLHLVQRLVVDDEQTLEMEGWQDHFDDCEECRAEWEAFARSLAIFRQLESERISRFAGVPGWEDFSQNLRGDWRRWRLLRPIRLPAAAAVAVALTVVGVSAWVAAPENKGESPVTAETTPPSSPVIRESNLPRVEPQAPRQPRFVSSRPANIGGALNQRPDARGAYVFELHGGEFKIGVIEVDKGRTTSSGGTSAGEITPSPTLGGQGGWHPPNTTFATGQPARVEYPIHNARTQ